MSKGLESIDDQVRDSISKVRDKVISSDLFYIYHKTPYHWLDTLLAIDRLACNIAQLEKSLSEYTDKPKVIACDFDGTLCKDAYPGIGEPRVEVIEYLKERQMAGDKIILWTCRVDEKLEEAINWCLDQGLIFDAINDNLPELVEKYGGNPRKVFADEYLDDRNTFMSDIEDKEAED